MKEGAGFREPEENRKKEPKLRPVGERSLWGCNGMGNPGRGEAAGAQPWVSGKHRGLHQCQQAPV